MKMQSIGFSASSLAHGAFALLLFLLVTRVPKIPAPTVIDFSLLAGPGENPAPVILPVPEPEAVTPAPKPVPVEVPKQEVRQEIVKLKPKKKIVKMTATPLPETVQVPAPAEVEQKTTSSASEVTNSIVPAAQAVTTRQDGGEPGPGESLTAEERWKHEQFNFIKEMVRKNMSYPILARKSGWQGRVLVSFVICLDGRVEDVRIEKSSGITFLDKNAVDTVKKSAPFPNPPIRATIFLPIDYTLS
jgi:protein TonB